MAGKKKETAEEAAAARAEFFANTRMNIDDTFAKIVNKMTGVPDDSPRGGRSNLVDNDNTYLAGRKVANEHMDWDSMLSKLGRTPQQRTAQRGGGHGGSPNSISLALNNRAMEQFQPIVNELSRFKFASSPDKRQDQMGEIVTAVKQALQQVAVRHVAGNTKQFYANAVKFARTNDGIKVTYKVANRHVVVEANGSFYGDEIVCLEENGTNVTAHVARQTDGGFEELTQHYSLKLGLLD